MPPFTYTPPSPDEPLVYGPTPLQAPEVKTPAAKEMDIAPRPLQAPGKEFGISDVFRDLAELVASSPATRNDAVRQAVLNMVQRQRQRIEQDRVSREMDFVTGHLQTALQSSDPKEIADTLKQLGGLNLHPEVAKRLQDTSLGMAEHLGRSLAFSKAVKQIPLGATREQAAKIFAENNVDPKLSELYVGKIPEKAGPIPIGAHGMLNPTTNEVIPGTVPTPTYKPIPVDQQIATHQKVFSLKERGLPLPPELQASLQVGPMQHDIALKDLERTIQSEANQKAAERAEQKQTAIEIARAGQAGDVIPKRFIDKEGNPLPNVTKGQWASESWRKETGAIQLATPQMEARWDSAMQVKNHYEAYLPTLDALLTNSSKPGAWLNTKVGVLRNDPRYAANFKALEAVTPFALAAGWTVGRGGGMRGGVKAAEVVRPAGMEDSDDMRSFVSKTKTMLGIIARGLRDERLPSAPIESVVKKFDLVASGKAVAVLLPDGSVGLKLRR